MDPNPLLVAGRHALPATPPQEEEEEEEEEDELASKAKRCKLASEEAFGMNPLPTIETFAFGVRKFAHSRPSQFPPRLKYPVITKWSVLTRNVMLFSCARTCLMALTSSPAS